MQKEAQRYSLVRIKTRKRSGFSLGRSILMILSLLFSIQAYSQDALSKKISLSLTEVSPKQALEAIQKSSGTRILFGEDINRFNSNKVSISKNGISIRETLDLALKNTGLTYEQMGNHILIKVKPAVKSGDQQPARQQNGRVSGKVVDEETGEPISNVTIRIGSKGTTSSIEGLFSLTLPKGKYEAEISSVGYGKKIVTDIVIKEVGIFEVTVTLKKERNTLDAVVVKSSARKEGVVAHYTRQKNAASVTDGISSEQIARTSDNNIGQVLKRVSGVTTVDNKYVVVRGLSDRYNQAMIDGVVLPSTNMNRRNFSFDVVPQELVSSVVVNKTATPDMSAEFSGGQVIVNTMDIPAQNFTTVSIGTGMNTQSTGKDFYTLGERKSADYLGLSNYRKEPAGLQSWYWHNGVSTPPLGPNGNYPADFPTDLELIPGSGIPYTSLDAIEQSRKLDPKGLVLNGYKAVPFSNARFALGRVYDLKNDLRFGFSGGATYRNQQTIVSFNNVRGNYADHNYMDSVENNPGRSYRFNSTIGAALNLGLQGKNFKIALKNMYSHIFQDQFNETYRISYGTSNETKYRELFQDPLVTAVWQHKLEGQNLLGSSGVKLDYTLGITRIKQQNQDQRRLRYSRTESIGAKEYYQTPNIAFENLQSTPQDYRLWTDVKETDYNWGLSFSKDFKLGRQIKNTMKLGYSGWNKHRTLGLTKLVPYTSFNDIENPFEGAYSDILSAEKIGVAKGQAYYWADDLNGPTFDGTMKTHAPYLMLDQRFFEKLRLVYGLRAEHYNLGNRQEEYIIRRYGDIDDNWKLFSTTGEKDWRLLPSVNLTYSLTPQMNARIAYSKTAIRPDFRETAYFGFYDFELDANISGRQLVSTIVDNFDLRYEWYPSAGEIISISGFYKKMKNPIELVFAQDGFYRFQNQYAAQNYGMEIEFRKSLGFIADKPWLNNFTLFGNATWLKSKVEAQQQPMPGENFVEQKRLPSLDRPLYGQAPWIINGGIAYQDDIFGFTASYNKSGHRSNTIHLEPNMVEYEKGRNLLDVQVSTRLLKQRAELKLDVSNLLDEYILFYQNIKGYETIPSDPNDPNSPASGWRLKNGSSTAYEPEHGDRVTYRAKTGRNISLSFTYKF